MYNGVHNIAVVPCACRVGVASSCAFLPIDVYGSIYILLLHISVLVRRQRFCLVYKHNKRGEYSDGEIEMTVEPPRDTRACSMSSRTPTERV